MSQHDGEPCVYFFGAMVGTDISLVKIGRGNTKDRLRIIGTSCPYRLFLLAEIDDPAPEILEKELHSRFSESRIHGEWFRFDKAIENYLAEACTS